MSSQNNPVLIVEDERLSRKALAWLLSECGYPTQAYETAEELLEEVDRGTRACAVLADVDLPGMSGMEMLSQLEKKNPGSRVPTVLITAAEGEHIARFCKEHGCKYLRKPLNLPSLLETLQKSGVQ